MNYDDVILLLKELFSIDDEPTKLSDFIQKQLESFLISFDNDEGIYHIDISLV